MTDPIHNSDNQTATTLANDFVVEDGTLDIDKDVNTTGHLTLTDGSINVAATMVATFN